MRPDNPSASEGLGSSGDGQLRPPTSDAPEKKKYVIDRAFPAASCGVEAPIRKAGMKEWKSRCRGWPSVILEHLG